MVYNCLGHNKTIGSFIINLFVNPDQEFNLKKKIIWCSNFSQIQKKYNTFSNVAQLIVSEVR